MRKIDKLIVHCSATQEGRHLDAAEINKAWQSIQFNKQEAEYLGWSLDNKYYLQAGASITSAALNIPLDRLYVKSENVKDAMNTQYENWQRLSMLSGYSKWNLGIEDGEKKKSNNGLNFDNLDFGGSLDFDKIKF